MAGSPALTEQEPNEDRGDNEAHDDTENDPDDDTGAYGSAQGWVGVAVVGEGDADGIVLRVRWGGFRGA